MQYETNDYLKSIKQTEGLSSRIAGTTLPYTGEMCRTARSNTLVKNCSGVNFYGWIYSLRMGTNGLNPINGSHGVRKEVEAAQGGNEKDSWT